MGNTTQWGRTAAPRLPSCIHWPSMVHTCLYMEQSSLIVIVAPAYVAVRQYVLSAFAANGVLGACMRSRRGAIRHAQVPYANMWCDLYPDSLALVALVSPEGFAQLLRPRLPVRSALMPPVLHKVDLCSREYSVVCSRGHGKCWECGGCHVAQHCTSAAHHTRCSNALSWPPPSPPQHVMRFKMRRPLQAKEVDGRLARGEVLYQPVPEQGQAGEDHPQERRGTRVVCLAAGRGARRAGAAAGAAAPVAPGRQRRARGRRAAGAPRACLQPAGGVTRARALLCGGVQHPGRG